MQEIAITLQARHRNSSPPTHDIDEEEDNYKLRPTLTNFHIINGEVRQPLGRNRNLRIMNTYKNKNRDAHDDDQTRRIR